MHSWPKEQVLAIQLHEHLLQVNITILSRNTTSISFPSHILTDINFAKAAYIIKYLQSIPLYLSNSCTTKENSINIGSIS